MGLSFKLFGKGMAERLISSTTNPFVGLFVGILVTSIIQSSSSTTSILVGLVAGGSMTIPNAIPIVMGANIGTTVTNTIVSLSHITRKQEFRRATAGATVHDFFNIFAVIIFFPLELKFHIIEKIATKITHFFVNVGGVNIMSPIKLATTPIVNFFRFICCSHPVIMLICALVLLFISLKFINSVMRGLVATKAERYLSNHIFGNPFRSFGIGMSLTAIVQSSSITTSIMVPLVGSGILSVEQIFPYILGANLGTTITTILAALGTGIPVSLMVALAHLCFNIFGIVLIYPLKWIPIGLARGLGNISASSRVLSIAYILVIFYVVPLIFIFLGR
jgi:sodium-dependent phosphate cotransporter